MDSNGNINNSFPLQFPIVKNTNGKLIANDIIPMTAEETGIAIGNILLEVIKELENIKK